MEQTAQGMVCVCVRARALLSPPTSPRTTVVMGTWLSEEKIYFHHTVFVLLVIIKHTHPETYTHTHTLTSLVVFIFWLDLCCFLRQFQPTIHFPHLSPSVKQFPSRNDGSMFSFWKENPHLSNTAKRTLYISFYIIALRRKTIILKHRQDQKLATWLQKNKWTVAVVSWLKKEAKGSPWNPGKLDKDATRGWWLVTISFSSWEPS